MTKKPQIESVFIWAVRIYFPHPLLLHPSRRVFVGLTPPSFPYALWNSRDILQSSDSSIMTCQVYVCTVQSDPKFIYFILKQWNSVRRPYNEHVVTNISSFISLPLGLQAVIPGLFTSITYLLHEHVKLFWMENVFCHLAMIMALPFPFYVFLRPLLYCLSLYFYVGSEIMHRSHIKWFCSNVVFCILFSFLESCRPAAEAEKGKAE